MGHWYPIVWWLLGLFTYHVFATLKREVRRTKGGGMITEFHKLKKF